MNFKKFNGSTWETVQHKIYGSGTDSLTAFPAQIQASGDPLTDYTITGNTVQDGTPTPEAPVDVVGCGERTNILLGGEILNNSLINVDNQWMLYETQNKTIHVQCAASRKYFLDLPKDYTGFVRVITVAIDATPRPVTNGVVMIRDSESQVSYSFTTPSDAKRIVIQVDAEYTQVVLANAILSTGYKLPLTVNGTEYPIYLGQVDTTRRIKKLVLTGGENWTVGSANYYSPLPSSKGKSSSNALCTHAKKATTIDNSGYNLFLQKSTFVFDTLADFKSYLAAQYQNGTPVTVWYVLANPKTGIVNEPLHKIGDYADTITMAQAETTIPTSDGDNTITFGTTVKPSAMSATFKGWHPVQAAKQYDGSEWR